MRTRTAITFACRVLALAAIAIVHSHVVAQEEADSESRAAAVPAAPPVQAEEAPASSEDSSAAGEDRSPPEDTAASAEPTDAASEESATGETREAAESRGTDDASVERPSPEALFGIVQIVVMDAGGEAHRVGSGFVVETNHVVTAAHLVMDEERIAVVPPTGEEYIARVRHVNDYADLALLSVSRLDLAPLTLAKDGFDEGRAVVSAGFWGDTTTEPQSITAAGRTVLAARSRGAVGEHLQLDATRGSAAVDLLRHNAMIPVAGYGGPLLNDCGEVAGVNRGPLGVSGWRLRRGHEPAGFVYAAGVTAIIGLLQPVGVTFKRTETTCADPTSAAQVELDQAEQRAAEEANRAEELARQAAEKEAEAEAKQAELEERQAELDAANAAVEDLESQYEEAVRGGTEEAESLRVELEEARANRATAQQVVDGLEGEVEQLEARVEGLQDEVEQGRQTLTIAIVTAIVALVLLAAVAAVFYRRRSLELAHAQRQGAGGPQTNLPRPNDVGGTHGPDYLLTGKTGDGVSVSLKVPGSMISKGVVVGRSPRNATFLIDDKTLSREHARLFEDGDGVLRIEDLDTTNGTRVNGQELRPRIAVALRDGDALELGAVKLQVARNR